MLAKNQTGAAEVEEDAAVAVVVAVGQADSMGVVADDMMDTSESNSRLVHAQ